MWREKQRGFSLIEGLIVISIVLVMAAMAAPQFREALTRYQMESAARNVEGLVHTARREAARQNRRVTLRISEMGGITTIFVDANGNGTADVNERRREFRNEYGFLLRAHNPADLSTANYPDYSALIYANSTSLAVNGGFTFSPDGTMVERSSPTAPWLLGTAIRPLTIFPVARGKVRFFYITITPAGNTRMWTTMWDLGSRPPTRTEPVSPV